MQAQTRSLTTRLLQANVKTAQRETTALRTELLATFQVHVCHVLEQTIASVEQSVQQGCAKAALETPPVSQAVTTWLALAIAAMLSQTRIVAHSPITARSLEHA